MRDLLSKLMTGSMIAGAALLVAACGGSEDATTNNANYVDETLMPNDSAVTDTDAMNGTTDNLGVAANTTETNVTTTTTTSENTTSTDTATNGM